MTGSERFIIHGRVHLSLEAVAVCYQVQVSFVQEVYEEGLLGRGETVDGSVVVDASQLDRVARIVRLHFHGGINLQGIRVLIGFPSGADS